MPEEQQLSMREQFQSAWEESEKDTAPVTVETEASPEVVAAVSEPVEEEQIEMFEKPEEKPKVEATQDEPESEAPASEKTEEKAPYGWSPANREHWSKLPPEVRAQITKRETETEAILRKTADARRVADQLARTVEPYRHTMAAAGYSDPFQAINTLFRAEATLRGGTQVEKARQLASLINQYGVDLNTLDSVLAGDNSPQQTNSQIQDLLSQHLAPVQQFMQQYQQDQQRQYQMEQERTLSEVQKFNPEFIADVRLDMADIMDIADKRGVKLSLQEAYDRACMMHPEISKIMAQRKERDRLLGTTETAQKKKAAATASLTGRQGGNPVPNGALSLRDQLSQAWDEQTG